MFTVDWDLLCQLTIQTIPRRHPYRTVCLIWAVCQSQLPSRATLGCIKLAIKGYSPNSQKSGTLNCGTKGNQESRPAFPVSERTEAGCPAWTYRTPRVVFSTYHHRIPQSIPFTINKDI